MYDIEKLKGMTVKEKIDWMTENVSLPDLMIDYGFEPEAGSGKGSPKLRHPVTNELYIVKKNRSGKFTFWSPHNESLKGSDIFNFIMDRHDVPISPRKGAKGDAISIIENYLKGNPEVTMENSYYKLHKDGETKRNVIEEAHNLFPLDASFLERRGIEKGTYTHPYFEQTVFKHKLTDKYSHVHYNTAFLMLSDKSENPGGLNALSLRNDRFKGFPSNVPKADSLYISNGKTNSDRFYFMESAIDCMSHFQMNRDKLEGLKVRYFSSEGAIVAGQTELFEKVCSTKKPAEIYVGTDNDRVGEVHAVKVMGILPGSGGVLKDSRINAAAVEDKKNPENSHGRMEITVPSANKEEAEIFKAELLEKLEVLNCRYENSYCVGKPFKLLYPDAEPADRLNTYTVKFPHKKPMYTAMRVFVQRNKHENSRTIFRELPKGKDFNEDLMNSLKEQKDKTETKEKPVSKGIGM